LYPLRSNTCTIEKQKQTKKGVTLKGKRKKEKVHSSDNVNKFPKEQVNKQRTKRN